MDISYSSNITTTNWSNVDASIYNDSYYAELEKRILSLMGDEEDDQGLQQMIGETREDLTNKPTSTRLPLWPDRVSYRNLAPEATPNLQLKPTNVTENGNGTGVFIPLPVPRTVHSGS